LAERLSQNAETRPSVSVATGQRRGRLQRLLEALAISVVRTFEQAMKEMQKASSETPGQRAALVPNRCYQCHGRFGLIRHRYALRHFCTKECVSDLGTTVIAKCIASKSGQSFSPANDAKSAA
jgi:hypothetical protein